MAYLLTPVDTLKKEQRTALAELVFGYKQLLKPTKKLTI